MNSIIIAVIGGLIACIGYWVDHNVIRAEQDTVSKDIWIRVCIGGAAISYIASMLMGYDKLPNITSPGPKGEIPATLVNAVSDGLEDTIKTGIPSF